MCKAMKYKSANQYYRFLATKREFNNGIPYTATFRRKKPSET